MQTSEEENMKIWKMIENTCVDTIKLYEKKNKKDPLEREYEDRVDFWNRYIEAKLAEVEFCCDRKYYYELKANLIRQAQCDLEPLIKILGERQKFENVTFIITADKNKVKENANEDV